MFHSHLSLLSWGVCFRLVRSPWRVLSIRLPSLNVFPRVVKEDNHRLPRLLWLIPRIIFSPTLSAIGYKTPPLACNKQLGLSRNLRSTTLTRPPVLGPSFVIRKSGKISCYFFLGSWRHLTPLFSPLRDNLPPMTSFKTAFTGFLTTGPPMATPPDHISPPPLACFFPLHLC